MADAIVGGIVKLEKSNYEQDFLKRSKYAKTLASLKLAGARLVIVAGILALWEFGVRQGAIDSFLMGSPSAIWRVGVAMVTSGQLFKDVSATLYATIVGFLIGSLLGSACGLLLWYFKGFAKVIDPFAVALNGVPKIALAPMIVIWFGTDIFSKIVLATISTFVVALLSAYQATHQIEESQINLMRSFGATRTQIFTKIIIPASLPWIISAFRINIGLSLVSVIGGEFISSDRGLGHMVFVEGNLFNLPAVWVGVIMLVILAISLYSLVGYAEKKLLPWNPEKSGAGLGSN
ncbi:MAG: ABC transporter permease [Negativicutes bacterium]|nr:ABC transporter permease [Negativicutes bacterium]